ncbi:uncharacterized protein LOC135398565 [Ornithodoros turicata]|uniref:uncharacterized protein LOC135398565 n=1 Tax=Ornithodoros turicata TaxID=34597 RepID=UPI003138BAAE
MLLLVIYSLLLHGHVQALLDLNGHIFLTVSSLSKPAHRLLEINWFGIPSEVRRAAIVELYRRDNPGSLWTRLESFKLMTESGTMRTNWSFPLTRFTLDNINASKECIKYKVSLVRQHMLDSDEITWSCIKVEECQRAWQNLRDRYARELRATKQPSGSGRSNRPEWPFMKPLSFLSPFIRTRTVLSRKTQGTIPHQPPTNCASSLPTPPRVLPDIHSDIIEEHSINDTLVQTGPQGKFGVTVHTLGYLRGSTRTGIPGRNSNGGLCEASKEKET